MSTNQLSVEITQEKSDAVDQLLNDLLVEMDFLVSLSIAGKKRLAKMGRKNVDFVNRSLRHAGGSTQFLPSFVTVDSGIRDRPEETLFVEFGKCENLTTRKG